MMTEYPLFVAQRVRNMLEQHNPIDATKAALKLFEIVIHFKSYYVFSYYLHLINNDPEFSEDRRINAFVRGKIDRLSYGDMYGLLKRILKHMKQQNKLGDFEDFYKATKHTSYNRAMDRLINLRNDIAHDRVVITNFNSNEIGETFFKLLGTVLKRSKHLLQYRIIVPIRRQGSNAYEVSIFKGSHSVPLFGVCPTNENLIDDTVYLTNEDNQFFINLSPFWAFLPTPESATKKLFLCTVEGEDKSVCCVEYFNNKKFYSEEMKQRFDQTLLSLMPDYKYQKDSYQKGFNLLCKRQTVHLTVMNQYGDLKTEHFIQIKKIKDNPNQKEQDKVKLDYHDAPYYPISDDEFQLKASDDNGNELPILYDIHNDGFRDFRIGTGKPLALDEEKKIHMSCFEPSLMKPLFEECEDYYEFDFSEPTEDFEFYIHFPKGIQVKTCSMFYLGKDKQDPINRNMTYDILNEEDGRQMIYAHIHRPVIEEAVKIEFTVNIDHLSGSDNEADSNKFYVGMKTYELLKDSEQRKWQVKQEEDGTIILKPE
ncbi:hypothetical protein SAMN05216225_10249 [Ornithinibacillus halophilus]|uniref:Swt1-like HEPN domain-containing protein n=2 Tax=Ornithinibacillus halophilus TaxID=930117 RepID=A0A1M5IH05_9BACI|nr:hypothetical protein SAMN05216225_10249 [Ornithinibacillus halophilus]